MIFALQDSIESILSTRHESSPEVLLHSFQNELFSTIKKVCNIVNVPHILIPIILFFYILHLLKISSFASVFCYKNEHLFYQ